MSYASNKIKKLQEERDVYKSCFVDAVEALVRISEVCDGVPVVNAGIIRGIIDEFDDKIEGGR